MKFFLTAFMLIYLSACMSATPKVNIIDSMGMTMELNKSAGRLATVALSPDGKYGVAAGNPTALLSRSDVKNAAIGVWDLSEGRLLNSLVSLGWNDAVAFSPDGKFVLSAGTENMKLWDPSSGKEIRQFPMRGYCVAFSPDSSKMLSCVRDIFRTGGLAVWDVKTGGLIKEIVSPNLAGKISVLDAVYSPDGKYILTGEMGSDNAYVRLWDATTGSELKKFRHTSHLLGVVTFVQAVDISPDGRYALGGGSGSFGGSIPLKMWDIASGKELRTIESPHSGLSGLTSAKFSPDGKYILSAGSDQVIKLWDASSGEEIRRFVGHSGNTYAPSVKGNRLYAAFSPDGKRILSAGNDAALRVWDVTTGKEIAMMVAFDDGEWLVITSEGYYNSSEKGAQYLTVKYEGKDYTVDQFYDVFYRPDIVAAKLRGEDISGSCHHHHERCDQNTSSLCRVYLKHFRYRSAKGQSLLSGKEHGWRHWRGAAVPEREACPVRRLLQGKSKKNHGKSPTCRYEQQSNLCRHEKRGAERKGRLPPWPAGPKETSMKTAKK